jgi:hypothetical protein
MEHAKGIEKFHCSATGSAAASEPLCRTVSL